MTQLEHLERCEGHITYLIGATMKAAQERVRRRQWYALMQSSLMFISYFIDCYRSFFWGMGFTLVIWLPVIIFCWQLHTKAIARARANKMEAIALRDMIRADIAKLQKERGY